MPSFRSLPHSSQIPSVEARPFSLEMVRSLVTDVLRPAHFFAGTCLRLEWEEREEEIAWEIFHGRLVDPAHTRERHRFWAWNIFATQDGTRSAEPLLSVKLDEQRHRLHVVRAIHSHAWEGYDAGGGVYLSRETRKWVRELVGTIDLAEFPDGKLLHDELICRLFQAVVGTSRLPLTSIEAPLPVFVLGQFAYLHRPGTAHEPVMTDHCQLVTHGLGPHLSWLEQAKLLETLLRVVPAEELPHAASQFMTRWTAIGQTVPDVLRLLGTLFNEVSLSPYTGLVERALAFLNVLEELHHLATEAVVDFLARLLRLIGRHLSAYDLVHFHHLGANYPDALLLNSVLGELLSRIERRPELFRGDDTPGRLRRRGLRQGWLLRQRYEGHLVPDVPTSPGEQARVLPSSFPRVPDEEILQPHRRRRRLFEGEPLAARLGPAVQTILAEAIADLRHPEELWELGTALVLDRPFGVGKARTEPDQTLLLSYEAFSATLARQRLDYLAAPSGLLGSADHAALRRSLDLGPRPSGLALPAVHAPGRPGAVSLADARRVADDFLLVRTMPRAVRGFLDHYDIGPLAKYCDVSFLAADRRVLLVSTGLAQLAIHDAQLRCRLLLEFDPAAGYTCRAGVEFPRSGLRVLESDGAPQATARTGPFGKEAVVLGP